MRTAPSKWLVFAGPSVDRKFKSAVLNLGGEIYPAAEYGFSRRIDANRGDKVLLIDGLVSMKPGPTHLDILGLLNKGVSVWGASSVGAARGVELKNEGMIPVGAIARLIGTLDLFDDAELCLAYSPEREIGITVPLINFRYSLGRLVLSGTVDRVDAFGALQVVKQIHFLERSVNSIGAALLSEKFERTMIDAITNELLWPIYDIKKMDAYVALRAMLSQCTKEDTDRYEKSTVSTFFIDDIVGL